MRVFRTDLLVIAISLLVLTSCINKNQENIQESELASLTKQYYEQTELMNQLNLEKIALEEENAAMNEENQILLSEINSLNNEIIRGNPNDLAKKEQIFQYLNENREKFVDTALYSLFDAGVLSVGERVGDFIVDEVTLFENIPSGGSKIRFSGKREISGVFREGGEASDLVFSVSEEDIYAIPNYYIADGVGLIITNLDAFVDNDDRNDLIDKTAMITLINLTLEGEKGSVYYYNCEIESIK